MSCYFCNEKPNIDSNEIVCAKCINKTFQFVRKKYLKKLFKFDSKDLEQITIKPYSMKGTEKKYYPLEEILDYAAHITKNLPDNNIKKRAYIIQLNKKKI